MFAATAGWAGLETWVLGPGFRVSGSGGFRVPGCATRICEIRVYTSFFLSTQKIDEAANRPALRRGAARADVPPTRQLGTRNSEPGTWNCSRGVISSQAQSRRVKSLRHSARQFLEPGHANSSQIPPNRAMAGSEQGSVRPGPAKSNSKPIKPAATDYGQVIYVRRDLRPIGQAVQG